MLCVCGRWRYWYSLLTFHSFASMGCVSIFWKLILWTAILCTCQTEPENPIDDNSAMVQVMAWCRQATIHYLNQYWPRFMSLYGVTMQQSVDSTVTSSNHKSGLKQFCLPSPYISIITRIIYRTLSFGACYFLPFWRPLLLKEISYATIDIRLW